jgi:hypothetical protein
MKRPACHHDFLAASRHLTRANSLAVIQGALLADAIAITRSVQHDVNGILSLTAAPTSVVAGASATVTILLNGSYSFPIIVNVGTFDPG